MPVTKRHMTTLSGSARKAMSTCSSPTGSQEYRVTTSERSSADRLRRSKYTPTEARNEAPTMAVAR